MLYTPLLKLPNWESRKMTKIKSVKFIIPFLFIALNIFAQSPSQYLSTDNRLKFGDYLFCDGDYLRAIDEYSFVLKEENNDSIKIKIGLAYEKLNRFEEAQKYFTMLNKNSPLINEANFEYYKSIYLSGFYTRLKGEYYLSSYFNSDYDSDINKLINLSKLYSRYETTDSISFFKPFNKKERLDILKLYLRKKNLETKIPVVAAFLSTVVPGLGKIYTKNYGDGITALLLTGVLTYLSVDNFNANHDFRGWLFGGLAAYFYAGNIYGSAASAQLYNANVRISFDSDLKLFLNRNHNFVPKSNWFCE